MSSSRQIRVRVLPDELEINAAAGSTFPAMARLLSLGLSYPCGGQGRCGSCRVRITAGAPTPSSAELRALSADELRDGERLACQCILNQDTEVVIPGASRLIEPKILTASGQAEFPLDPAVVKFLVHAEAPTVEQPLADLEIVRQLLPDNSGRLRALSLAFLRNLPFALREGTWRATVTECDGTLVDVEPGDATTQVHGISIDLGTTTVAASIHSLRNGTQLALTARMNPQVMMGEDVISRINRTFRNPDGLRELQALIAGCINGMMRTLCHAAAVPIRTVYEITVAGNAVMNHLLLGVPPENIGLAPYTPVYRTAPPVRATDLGIDGNPEARLCVLPNIGGFVGGDTVAGLLVTDFAHATDTALFIDIGTNCEVVLVHEGRMLAASAPAGPALEGACIEFGMRAEPGAIDDFILDGNAPEVHTIDGQPARGLCGSGLVHAIAALRDAAVLRSDGRFTPITSPSGLRMDRDAAGLPRILLAAREDGAERDVWLTQKDVREFQLARAAITSAWKTLCEIAGVEPDNVRRVFVAGAFGNYIRPEAALSLGLTPSGRGVAVSYIGNSSLEGARKVLLNREARALANRLPDLVQFVELAGRESFDELFAMELALGQ